MPGVNVASECQYLGPFNQDLHPLDLIEIGGERVHNRVYGQEFSPTSALVFGLEVARKVYVCDPATVNKELAEAYPRWDGRIKVTLGPFDKLFKREFRLLHKGGGARDRPLFCLKLICTRRGEEEADRPACGIDCVVIFDGRSVSHRRGSMGSEGSTKKKSDHAYPDDQQEQA